MVRRAGSRLVTAIAVTWVVMTALPAAQRTTSYPMTGFVISVDRANKSFVVSHESVPGVMPAMTMPFDVQRTQDLEGIGPGMTVRFTLVLGRQRGYAERIEAVPYVAVERDPLTASRLALLSRPAGASTAVPVGGEMPDFTLLDQARRPVSLSQFRGAVVAINFIYTSCPLPQFCFRMASHFAAIERRFASRLGKDLLLLTVTFDPRRDTPERLAEYASQWQADPNVWRFLTGEPAAIERVCGLFGVEAFPDEGLINHSLHTAIIGRDGRLVANIEGNRFTTNQLADLVAASLAR